MAEAPAGGTSRQESANEARLRAARRGGSPGGGSEPPGAATPGPSESDRAAAWTREQRTSRASDEAAAQNKERNRGITQRAGVQIDRKRTEYVPETRVGNLTISRGRQVTEREEMGAGAKKGGEGGGMSLRTATQLAKKNPYALAATTAAGAAKGALTGEMGNVIEQGKAMVGRGCVKGLWSFLWPSFGHTIYPIAIIYLISGNSRYARQYLPEMGDTWIPPEMLKKIPKPLRIPLKLGELLAIMFILFWVLLMDLACLGLIALILGVIISAKDFVGL